MGEGRMSIKGLGGNPRRNETDLALAELGQPQYLHAQNIPVELNSVFYISGVHYKMILL